MRWEDPWRLRPTPVGTLLVTVVAAVCLGALVGFGIVPPAPPRPPLTWGVYLPDDAAPSSSLSTVTAMAGEKPQYVMRFAALDEAVPLAALARTRAAGSTPIVTLEPWVPGGGVAQPGYSLASVARGAHDEALQRWARGLASLHSPVLLRFAHEMNSTWYPWAVGVNGNTAAGYVTAWNHVRKEFAAAGASQVRFVWAPNVPFPGSQPLPYPGDAAVDYLGLDGYNWGAGDGHAWQSPRSLFSAGLAALRALPGSRPILVTEVASAEGPRPGADKASWISSLVEYLRSDDRVLGFVWFQATKERDWRFNSTSRSEHAMRDAVAHR